MAKQSGPIKVSGKVGDVVHAKTKQGHITRTAPKPSGNINKSAAFRAQNGRTGRLNTLAGSISSSVDIATRHSLSDQYFYRRLNKVFRTESADDRILLLNKMYHVEAHERNTFSDICPEPKIILEEKEDHYAMAADVLHAAYPKRDADSFYLQFFLFIWKNEDLRCRFEAYKTEWMGRGTQYPRYYDFTFQKQEGDEDYLVACRCVGGKNMESEERRVDQGLKFLFCGSNSESGKKLLAERAESLKNVKRGTALPAVEEQRVAGRTER